MHAVLDPLRPQHIIAATAMNGLMEFEVAPDLRVSIESLPNRPTRGTPITAVIRVGNGGPLAASDVKVDVTLPPWLTLSRTRADCSVGTGSVRCALGAISTASSRDLTIELTVADTDASGTFVAAVSGHESDPDTSNNSASLAIATTSPAPPPAAVPAGSGGAGGGGSLDWISITVLLYLMRQGKAGTAARGGAAQKPYWIWRISSIACTGSR
jgi:hypothetical protein